ncbi:MAG: Ig-like domain-containing protein [Chitinophagales bacterium]
MLNFVELYKIQKHSLDFHINNSFGNIRNYFKTFTQVKTIFSLFFLFYFTINTIDLSAATEKYRIMWRDDPSTTICVGWSQIGGGNATVYYDTTDHGGNLSAFQFSHGVDRSTNYKGMDHRFSRISGLQPNTAYYFYIEDADGPSQIFWFKTVPDHSYETLSIVAGGDSRNNRTPRQKANYMVSRLRPHAVFFGGDMTDGNSNGEWQDWLDDWQLTIGSDGRMIPIIAARGNHEFSNNDIIDIFDTPGGDVYYALSFGGDLLRAYTLNSMIFAGGAQNSWLDNDLTAHSQSIWKMAQYHLPTRPHVSSKFDNPIQYASWAQTFYNHNVQLAVECDAHCVKTTWPVIPDTGPGSDEGFLRDDLNGTVYTGEGCWGAPTRSADDTKSWTRSSGSFNQFKWILIDRYKMEIRTIKVDNAYTVGMVDDEDLCKMPNNLDVWDPGNGDKVVVIENPDLKAPDVGLIQPENGLFFVDTYPIQFKATASDNNGSGINYVEFLANNQSIGRDSAAPYSIKWAAPAFGNYMIRAKAVDNNGETKKSECRDIAVGVSEGYSYILNTDDDAEELQYNNSMILNSDVLKIVESGSVQKVGLRFSGLNLPKDAQLIEARIVFTASHTDASPANINIKAQRSASAPSFSGNLFDIYFRQLTQANVNWQANPWINVGSTYSTPDLSNVIQEVQNLGAWNENSPLVFVLGGSGTRRAVSFDGNTDLAPRLYLKYDYGNNRAPELGPDQEICSGQSIILDAGNRFNLYEWNGNTLQNLPTLTVSNTGFNEVWVRSGLNNQVVAYDSVSVEQINLSVLNLGADQLICRGDSLLLASNNVYDTYQWSTGDASEMVKVGNEGFYKLTAAIGACETSDSVQVGFFPEQSIPLPGDTLIQNDSQFVLDAGNPAFVDYQWSDGTFGAAITIDAPGTYTLTATDSNNCEYYKSVVVNADILASTIEEKTIEAEIFPNPVSDKLFVQLKGDLTNRIKEIGIYTADGRMLKNFQDFSEKNIELDLSTLNSGVYFLVLRSADKQLNKKIVKL